MPLEWRKAGHPEVCDRDNYQQYVATKHNVSKKMKEKITIYSNPTERRAWRLGAARGIEKDKYDMPIDYYSIDEPQLSTPPQIQAIPKTCIIHANDMKKTMMIKW